MLGYPWAGAAVTPRRWPWAGRVRAWLQSSRCFPQSRGVAPPGAWACIPRLPTGLMLSLAHLSTWFLGSEKEAAGTGFDLGLYLSLVAQRVESPCSAGDPFLIPGLGRSPGGGHGNPLQYSCLENLMDRGAWWATVCGVAKRQT